jgi:hypothetical protein
VTLHYRLVLSGLLPQTTVKLLHARFGIVDLVAGRASTTVIGIVDDQPALRALLSLIWDTGGTVLSLDTSVGDSVPSPAFLHTAYPDGVAIKEDR